MFAIYEDSFDSFKRKELSGESRFKLHRNNNIARLSFGPLEIEGDHRDKVSG